MIREVPPERLKAVTLTLLAGYLGAGKTTLLNHVIHQTHDTRIGVLVNDFGDIDIDAKLVARADGETITLANGCICCTIRDDLVLTLFRLLHRSDPPDHVLIECSGVSDPAEVLRGFEQAQLHDIVRIDAVIGVVDGEQFAQQNFRDDPTLLHQLVMSDLVVLNKIDLIDEPTRARVETTIAQTVPNARIIPASFGAVPVEVLLGVGRMTPSSTRALHEGSSAHEHHDHGQSYATWSRRWRQPLAPGQVKAMLDALPPSVYRLKGFIQLRDEPRKVIVQIVGGRVALEFAEDPWDEPEQPESMLVAIGPAASFDPSVLDHLLEVALTATEEGESASPLGRWLRKLWPARSS